MKRIKILVLNKKAEVFQTFVDVDSAIGFLARTGYVNNKTVIFQKGDNAKVFETIGDVIELQKQLQKLVTDMP